MLTAKWLGGLILLGWLSEKGGEGVIAALLVAAGVLYLAVSRDMLEQAKGEKPKLTNPVTRGQASHA